MSNYHMQEWQKSTITTCRNSKKNQLAHVGITEKQLPHVGTAEKKQKQHVGITGKNMYE